MWCYTLSSPLSTLSFSPHCSPLPSLASAPSCFLAVAILPFSYRARVGSSIALMEVNVVSPRCERQQEEGKVNRLQRLSLLHTASRRRRRTKREREREDSVIEAELGQQGRSRARRTGREREREGEKEVRHSQLTSLAGWLAHCWRMSCLPTGLGNGSLWQAGGERNMNVMRTLPRLLSDTGQKKTPEKKDGRRMSFQRPKGTIEYSVSNIPATLLFPC